MTDEMRVRFEATLRRVLRLPPGASIVKIEAWEDDGLQVTVRQRGGKKETFIVGSGDREIQC